MIEGVTVYFYIGYQMKVDFEVEVYAILEHMKLASAYPEYGKIVVGSLWEELPYPHYNER